jgi:hypothetical protein
VFCPPCSHSVCRKMFRMDKTSFLNLHSKIKDVLCKSWTARSARMAKVSSVSHVSSLLHFASTLRWLAGGSPWDIAYAFHVSYATLHAKKYKVVEAINQALHNNIAFPTSEAELQRLVRTPRTRLTSPPLPSPTLPSRSQAEGFANIAGGKGRIIPNVVAAVDSVVIPRKRPVASKEKNISGQYNRKGCFATTMLAFVDASSRFLSISIVCASSAHDSTLFACSKLGQKIVNGGLAEKWTIVGDDAFINCSGSIITPFTKHTLTARQRNFNYFCSLVRQVVECAFGRWKQKWGILWRPLLVDVENIKSVVECTCRLHNYCIDCNCADASFVPPLQDLWWQRTASPKKIEAGKAPPPPRADMRPIWASAACVQRDFGIGNGPTSMSRREHAVRLVELSGLVAPDATGTWAREQLHKKRVDALAAGEWTV